MKGELSTIHSGFFLVAVGLSLAVTPVLADQVNTSLQTTNSNQNNTTIAQIESQSQVLASPTPLTANIDQGSVAIVKNPDVNTGTVVTNINQENNVYLGPKPTPTPTPSPTPRIVTNDYVGLFVTDNLDTFRPGQRFTYEVIVRNALPWDVQLNKVRIRIPEFVIPNGDEVTPNSVQNPGARTIEWQNQIISTGAEVRYSVPAQVDPTAPNGLVIVTNADINGNAVSRTASDQTTVVRFQAIAAAHDVAPQATQVVYTPAPAPRSVRITATTGPELFGIIGAPIATLLGAFGLRKSWQIWG